MAKYGFADADWDAAKKEVKNVLIEQAKCQDTIPYSDVTNKITAIDIEANDPRFFHLLGEISTEENNAGRGMLSALVVHKSGDMKPGPGFFELAKELGHDTTDNIDCWVRERNKVYAYWKT